MAQFSSHFKLGLIRRIWEAAPDGGNTFFEALNALQSARFEDVKAGRMVVSTSANGNAVSFLMPGGMPCTPQEFFELIEELLISYESGQSAGLTDESQIRDYMREQYRSIKSYTSNFMYLAK